MRDDDKKQFAQIVRTTMLVCGGEAPEADVLRVWWAALAGHEIADVSAAFSQYATRGKFAPKPADILEILDRIKPDGRPGADEAWAMIPRDEYTSAVMTTEMAEALGIAQPLLDEGDQVAARMAFKEAYTRLVDEAKRNGKAPAWFPSLGHDPRGRESVLTEAVRLGRLPASQVSELLPSPSAQLLAIENKSAISPEKAKENIARLHAIIGKSRIASEEIA